VWLKSTLNSPFLRRSLIAFCHYVSGYCVLCLWHRWEKEVNLRQENLSRCLIKHYTRRHTREWRYNSIYSSPWLRGSASKPGRYNSGERTAARQDALGKKKLRTQVGVEIRTLDCATCSLVAIPTG